jgi:hypothetical protein
MKMSEPKRWKLGLKRCNCVQCESAITFEQTEENCGWVMWEHHKDEVTRLKAEVERLTKAGDAMASIIKYEPGVNTFDPVPDVVKRWLAAKEGKPSV